MSLINMVLIICALAFGAVCRAITGLIQRKLKSSSKVDPLIEEAEKIVNTYLMKQL